MDIEIALRLLAGYYGVDQATVLATIAVVITVSNLISRIIPDDAIGWVGFIRKIASFIGLHVGNRLTAGITTNDAAAMVIEGMKADPVMNHIAEESAGATGRPLFPSVKTVVERLDDI